MSRQRESEAVTDAERRAAEKLLALLPVMEAEGYEAAPSWGGGEQDDGTLQMPYPNYTDEIGRFIELAHAESLLDRQYVNKNIGEWFERPGYVERASFSEVKSMLTFMVRGERFCDGHIASLFEQGHVVRVLRRLRELAIE